VYAERELPYDLDAEEAVLGSLLIDPDSIFRIATSLKPEDFYRESNQLIYQACFALYQRNEVINQITLAQELSGSKKLEDIGGAAYLSHLVSIVPTSIHIEHYAHIVSRLSLMRHLISAAGQIATIGYEAEPDVDAALSKAEAILFRLRHGEGPRDFVHLRKVLGDYLEENAALPPVREGYLPHVFTGFPGLDNILGGLQRSDVIVLGARPSVGKSSLALSIARNAAVEQGAHVAIFSMEMAKEQVAQRLVSNESGVDSSRIRFGLHSEAEEKQVMDAIGVLSNASIYIDDSPVLGALEMRSKARRLHNEVGIDLMVVDYIQLMHGNGRFQNPVQEMTEISRALKALARELYVPLLAVSQLSRAAEQRPSHRPVLSDLRESGSIEQDADVVLFIYREDKYSDRETWEKTQPDRPYPQGIAEIIVAKHRNGPVGEIQLHFRDRIVKFESMGCEYEEPAPLFR
jgi:replicative DNA helicase